ncbi:MAG: hypothetical protein LBR74_06815 [Eubacterium sp.]|jgi:hypothetical protein|nr:hypothetical protein [Eubacterium sp.]
MGKIYEKADFFEVKRVKHPISTLRAEMRNKKVHKIVYYKEFAKYDLFNCEMTVEHPNRRETLDRTLSRKFERLVETCKYI